MSDTPFMHLIRPNVAAPAVASATGPASVKINTSAVFQILEIVSKQLLPSNNRVIGTLLGNRSDDGTVFEIRDAFMVPCKETGDSVQIDDHIHKTLYQLYKKAHPKETVLGWFGCGSEIDSTTGLIHDFYSKGVDRAFPYPAVYLSVDYLSADGQINLPKLTCYIGAAIGKPNFNTMQRIGWKTQAVISSYVFTPIPHEINNGTVSEKLAVNMVSDANNVPGLAHQIKQVSSNIDLFLAFINGLNPESIKSDENVDLLRHLCNNLLNKPQILGDLDNLKALFRAHNQDVIMVEYLTKAVKEQIELSARLSAEAERSR